MLSDKVLTELHAKVYRKHGYTFQTGLRAFMRGRRWAKSHTQKDKPPVAIADKLLLWAEINREIKIEILKAKEVLANEQPKISKAGTDSPVTKVSEKPSGN